MLGRGLIPPFWLMASDGTTEFSVSVCHFTVHALCLSMLSHVTPTAPLLVYQSPQC